ncbi:HTTM domain-containing protein [Yinghuangia sp. ASG 101]|uniref:HTTM domain-containing protein n=1 Tax=Yinghuangia sp. ASG 101 TaxID=2896848 RepID=UPI001E338DB1|nr:HTTM domain-containing protein [Yinghuangia sp. ASG 101]UGQ15237.1 HTTM domain-containing protein [Yinghuangia sp. ASG 101]
MTSVDPTPDATPDPTPGSAPDSAPGPVPEALPESAPGPAPAPAAAARGDAGARPVPAVPRQTARTEPAAPDGGPETAPAPAHPAPAAAPARQPLDLRVAEAIVAFFARVSGRPRGTHQAALLRIGFGAVFLVSLLREFLNRRELWGDRSPWSPDMARRLLSGIDGVSILLVRDDRWWFELMYVLAVVVTALFVLGWHTRAMSVLFCLVVVSFNSRSLLMTDGGDTVLTLMSFYLMFTASGRVWSLDARRLRRTGRPRSPGPGQEGGVFVALVAAVAVGLVLPWWTSLLGAAVVLPGLWRLPRELEQLRAAVVAAAHHCALFVIAAQVCVIYAAAGLFKVQGETWQDGTALHYALNLEYFQPWPWLSDLADGGPVPATALAYLTVFTQVGFVFLVFAKRAKYVVIAVMVAMHLGIALLLGLPAFSASMALGDLVFLPTAFLLAVRAFGGRLLRRGKARAGGVRTGRDGGRGGGSDEDVRPGATATHTA